MTAYKSRLQDVYEKQIVADMQKQFGYENVMQVPKILKIIINIAPSREAVLDAKVVDKVVEELMLITGQKPVITRAKKSIATFKLREGMPVGAKVTLRKHMMYDFIDRFVNIALPRVKDFRGLSGKTFDGNGNYSIGLKEQIVFPEINYDKVDKIRGMNIVFVTNAKTDEEAKALLKMFNFPINN